VATISKRTNQKKVPNTWNFFSTGTLSVICVHSERAGKGMIDREDKGATSKGARRSDLGLTDAIASQLKQYYTSVEEEPIPDNLLSLLEKLDEAERSGGSNGAN